MNFSEGLYSDTSIHNVPSGLSQGQGGGLYVQSNVVTSYKIGIPTKRCGYALLGDVLQASKSITGLFNYRESSVVQTLLATINDATDDDTQLFALSGGTWSEITAAETAWANKANINVEMEHFLGECFFVGHGTTDGFISPRNYRLSTDTFGTNNTTGMPSAKFIKRYRDRLYIANTFIGGTATPFRMYYSTVPSSGAITWDTTNNYIDVDYNEAITGIGSNWDKMVLFTEYSAFFFTNPPIIKKLAWDVGCSNHRTIRNIGQYMIWTSMDGVHMSQGGGYPVNISGRVKDFVQFVNTTNSFAEVVDEEYHLYIGAVTVNGISYANTTLIFNLATGTWRVHEYYDNMSVFAKYYINGQDFMMMGSTSGFVHQLGKYTDSTLVTTDNSQPIHSMFQTGALDFGHPSLKKMLNNLTVYSDRAQGLSLKARVIDANNQGVSHWQTLGELSSYITEFSIRPREGNFIQIEGVENGSNQYWSLLGMTYDVDVIETARK